jgi:glutamine amidotransferase
MKVVIVDYGIGNLRSVERACEVIGYHCIITSDKAEISNADALILPGVGAFGDAMKNLQNAGLIETLIKFTDSGKYVMGVCLGMQLLMSTSEEFGLQYGLGIIDGKCQRFDSRLVKVPQINWNTISPYGSGNGSFDENSPLHGIKPDTYMYFVHSYYVIPENPSHILSVTNYGGRDYASSVRRDNIFAFQFHPEKSGEAGLSIYKNFFKIVEKNG